MKKLMLVLAAGSLSAPAMAADGVVLEQFEKYNSRGQCESALAQERNAQRKDPATRGSGYEGLSGSDFNKASRTTTRCEERDGKYVVVFYQDGF